LELVDTLPTNAHITVPLIGGTIDNHDLHLTYTKIDEKLKNNDLLNSVARSSIHGIDPAWVNSVLSHLPIFELSK
jgi:hypothetical protein